PTRSLGSMPFSFSSPAARAAPSSSCEYVTTASSSFNAGRSPERSAVSRSCCARLSGIRCPPSWTDLQGGLPDHRALIEQYAEPRLERVRQRLARRALLEAIDQLGHEVFYHLALRVL